MATTSGGPRQRPPPPPLRLKQSAFDPSPTPSPANFMTRGEITTTTAPGSGPNTPATAQRLLYELPPELIESRRRMAQEQQERSRARHTLQTQYRAQQAAAISSRSRSGSNDAAVILQPRPLAANMTGMILDDTSAVEDFELRTPNARHSISGPPSSRPRSATPSHALMSPVRSDLETFAQNCKAWFFAQDAAAGKAMTDTLATLPPNQKATFTKLQASVRSAYHTWTSLRRLQEFRAFLASTTPGASLTPPARADPHSPLARKERLERFGRFVQTFCLSGTPGTHPFFEGLYGLLRLQSLGENLGGAGSARIEWEIDDSVFLESGGKDFTTEAINNLKGVLGFEECLVESASDDSFAYEMNPSESEEDENFIGSGTRSPAVYTPVPTGSTRSKGPPPAVPSRPKPKANQASGEDASGNRGRAGSDPFMDQTTGLLSGSSAQGQAPSSSFVTKSAASGGLLSGIDEGAFTHDDDSGVDSPSNSYGVMTPLASAMREQQQHTRHQSQPLPSAHTAAAKVTPKPRPPPPKRQHSKNGSNGGAAAASHPISPSYSTFQQHDFDLDLLLSSGSSTPGLSYRPPTQAELDLLHTPQLRVWTIPPYLTNPEIMSDLLPLFPSFITNKALPRFTPVKPPAKSKAAKRNKKKKPDVEEGGALGVDEDEDGGDVAREARGEVKKGTGRMWIGEKVRDDGWRGGFWTRLMLWFKGMFR